MKNTICLLGSCPHEPLPIRSNFLLCSSQMATFVFSHKNIPRQMDKSTFEHKRKSFVETGEIYFWTATINKWQYLLKEEKYKDVIINSR